MAWEPTFIEDGDAASGTLLNAVIGGAESWVNAIDRAGWKRGAINRQTHLEFGPFAGSGTFTVKESAAKTTYALSNATFGTSLDYVTYGTDGNTDRVQVGHSATGSLNPCELAINGGTGWLLGMENGQRCGALVVLWNVEYWASSEDAPAVRTWICFTLQFFVAGLWITVKESERWVSHEGKMIDHTSGTEQIMTDVPMMTVITADMVTDGGGDPDTNPVTAIRGMVSIATDGGVNTNVTLWRWNLTAMPLHCQLESV